jgi:hypothetical protein
VAQYLLYLAEDVAWHKRLDVPGRARGMFTTQTAEQLCFTGYQDAILAQQGRGFLKSMFPDMAGWEHGLVPGLAFNHNSSHFRGNPMLTNLYDAGGRPRVSPVLNVTQYPYPRTWETGVLNHAVMGEFRFMVAEDIARYGMLDFRQGGRTTFHRVLRGKTDFDGGGTNGMAFPPLFDIWRRKTEPESLPYWSDTTYRPLTLKYEEDANDQWTGTSTRRYRHSVGDIPRLQSDAYAPFCMRDLSNLNSDITLLLGPHMYGNGRGDGCSPNEYASWGVRGLPRAQRATYLPIEGAAWPGQLTRLTMGNEGADVHVEPITGRVYSYKHEYTNYVQQSWKSVYLYKNVARGTCPYSAIQEWGHGLNDQQRSSFQAGLTDLKLRQGVSIAFGIMAAVFCITFGAGLRKKTAKKWRQMHLISPGDLYTMQVKAHAQMLYEKQVAHDKEGKVIFKEKSKMLKAARKEQELEYRLAMAALKERNAKELRSIDAICEVDEKGDLVMPFYTGDGDAKPGDARANVLAAKAAAAAGGGGGAAAGMKAGSPGGKKPAASGVAEVPMTSFAI